MKRILLISLLFLLPGRGRAEWDSMTFGAVGFGLTYTFVDLNRSWDNYHPQSNKTVDEFVIPLVETLAWTSMQQGYTCWNQGTPWNWSHWYSPLLGAGLAVTIHAMMVRPYVNPSNGETGIVLTFKN